MIVIVWMGGAVNSFSLPLTDHYPKPSISASPSTEVLAGQDWTVCCQAPLLGVNFVLYQARDFRIEVTPRGDSDTAEFSLKNVTMADAGRYTCYYHSTIEPIIWSNASDPVQLKVIGEETFCYLGGRIPNFLFLCLQQTYGKQKLNCSSPPYIIIIIYYLHPAHLAGFPQPLWVAPNRILKT
uniref:Ig-like domain-containing protein n=1 Tax=Podarcis muralis TaxID=64176 RepID=A0A670K7S8_PODMU